MPLIEYHRHAPAPEPGPEEARRVWLNETIEALRAEPARADAKAALLLVAPSAGLALGVGQLDGLPVLATAVGWTSVSVALIAIGLLGAVVWPQLDGAAPPLEAPAVLAAAEAACDDPEADLAERAVEVARLVRITNRKYRLLRAAIGSLGAAIAIALTAVMLA